MRVLLVSLVVSLGTGDALAGVTEVNQLFVQGEYEKAAAGYEALLAEGLRHEVIYYNLGNAYFRQGEVGHAAYNYERALRLDPTFADAAFNLNVVRGIVDARVEGERPEPFWLRALYAYSKDRLALLVLILNTAFFLLLLALRFLVHGLRRYVAVLVVVCMGAGLFVVSAVFFARLYHERVVQTGIVLSENVRMREGPEHSAGGLTDLEPGLRVRVMESRLDWLRVRLTNGVEGWVPGDDVGRLE